MNDSAVSFSPARNILRHESNENMLIHFLAFELISLLEGHFPVEESNVCVVIKFVHRNLTNVSMHSAMLLCDGLVAALAFIFFYQVL